MTPSYIASLLRLTLHALVARPAVTLSAAGFMFANNLVFFVTWAIYFANFSALRGWRLEDVALLIGMVVWAYGVAVVFAGGVRTMARTIVDGGLDVHLGRPQHPLPSLLFGRPVPSGLGDMASALPFWLWLGGRSVSDLPLLILAATSAAVILGSAVAIMQCLVFWWPRALGFCEQLYEMFVMVTYYPQHAYGFGARVLLLTVFPAALIGFLPTEAVRAHSALLVAAVVGAAVVYAALALLVFNLGLRRYASGNRFAELR
ncbi:MAG TPA: ABC-2 family transporter protein [Stellaceae bacterium]|nr:ABC-2 family transporter protein [Stellaceae bacterium]